MSWSRAEAHAALHEHGFPTTDPIGRALLEMARPSIRLHTLPYTHEPLPLATSKYFGRPDLPTEVEWPMLRGDPLVFVAQINLAEMTALEPELDLPRSGLLSFFCWAEEPGAGAYELVETGSGVVLFSSFSAPLVPRELPLAVPRFKECRFEARVEPTLPPYESPELESLGFARDPNGFLPHEPWQRYLEVAEALARPYGGLEPVHRVLGYPHQVQGALQAYCPSRSSDWRLLLQLDSDRNAGVGWGDAGALYFMIRQDDLAAARFDNTYFVEQCC
jgi:uncharacterized protein YwqG